MTIKERIKADLITAMKAQEKERLGTLRLIQAAFRKKEIDSRIDLDDAGMTALLANMAKQRKDSIEQFQKGGRDDLVLKETNELLLIESYMPKPLSPEELSKAVEEAIAETGATSLKDMGNVMKVALAKTAGKADGKELSQLVRSKLSP